MPDVFTIFLNKDDDNGRNKVQCNCCSLNFSIFGIATWLMMFVSNY